MSVPESQPATGPLDHLRTPIPHPDDPVVCLAMRADVEAVVAAVDAVTALLDGPWLPALVLKDEIRAALAPTRQDPP